MSAEVLLSNTAVVGCADYASEHVELSVQRIFNLLGGVKSFVKRGDRVLLKPNLIVPNSAECAAQTHPAVILAAAKLLKDFGAVVCVGDSPAWGNARICLRALGIERELERMGIEIVPLNRPVWTRLAGARVGISRAVLEADAILNLPKFKAHQQLGATFAIKNMFGCVAGKEKPIRHYTHGGCQERFCQMLIEIYRHLNPVLNLIDGITAMEGQGPISGTPKHLGVLIGGRDPIACERVCCRIVQFRPEEMPILTTANTMGFGISLDESPVVVGDPIQLLICGDFQPAVQTPLRFGLTRIVKSIAKQGMLLLKSRSC